MSHIIAFIAGIVVATVGFTNVAIMADNGVAIIKEQAQQAVQK